MQSKLARGAEYVGAAIFAFLFGLFVLQVTMRFLFDQPLGWSDELIVVVYILAIFWANATMVRERDHVMFDLAYAMLPPGGRRAFALVGSLLVAGLFLYSLPYAFDYVRFMYREATPVIEIRFAWVFAPFLLFLAAVGLFYAWKFVRLLGRNWSQHI